MSYSAIICKIKVSPIPNANTIQVANCAGYTAIVGINHKDGELGIFFPHDGQLTWKLHGTSQRSGFVKSNSILSKTLVSCGFKQKYISVYGSRNLTLPHKLCPDLYRPIAHKLFEGKLNKDEIVYYEIVGFGENNSSIMQSHTISDAKISKRFANPMYYSYGMKRCENNEPKYQENFDIYVYRIMQNGKNLSPTELQIRVKQLGMKIVPHVWTGIWDPENIESFLKDCKKITEENGCRSEIDGSHIEEGICIRFYGPLENGEFLDLTVKYKSWLFCDCEGIAKNSDTYVDAEEIEGEE